MIRKDSIQNLRVSDEVKKFLLEKTFRYSILIQPGFFVELLFLAFVDYYYIYKNNCYKNLLISLANKHNKISTYIAYLLELLERNEELIKSGAHHQSEDYFQVISSISKYLQSTAQKEAYIQGTNLFVTNLKYLLSLSVTFRVFECTNTRNFTRSYGKNSTDILYFIKTEDECHVLFPDVNPNEPLSINYPFQYPRAILSCGQSITEADINRHNCKSSSKHNLYTQEKCLIRLKTCCQKIQNICVICKIERQFAYICERCEGNNCLACIGKVKQFLCKQCGFSNIYQRFKNRFDPFNYSQSAHRSAGQNFSCYQNSGNINYSHHGSQPMNTQFQNTPQMPNPYYNHSQATPITNYQICPNCKDYIKCKMCTNLIYRASPTGLCKSCLPKKCKTCESEALNLLYCPKCQSCTNCKNPLENLLGCCMKCDLKKKFFLQNDVLNGESEIIFNSHQNDKCLKCQSLLGSFHKDKLFCCKCKDMKYEKMCIDCKTINYADKYGHPAATQDFQPIIPLTANLAVKNLDVPNCKECLNERNNVLVSVCICAEIVVPKIEVIESQLESYISNNFT